MQRNLPGNPSDAGPLSHNPCNCKNCEPPPDWRELLMIAGEELQFVRNHSFPTPAEDKHMRLAAIGAAQLMLEQAARQLA